MLCPYCKDGSMNTVDSGKNRIDQCDSCGAAWFDQGEIGELTEGRFPETAESTEGEPFAREKYAFAPMSLSDAWEKSASLSCPKCSKPLTMVDFQITGIPVFRCRGCGGMLLTRYAIRELAGKFHLLRKKIDTGVIKAGYDPDPLKGRGKTPIFTIVEAGLYLYLSYLFLSLWINPRINEIKSLSTLMFFIFFFYVFHFVIYVRMGKGNIEVLSKKGYWIASLLIYGMAAWWIYKDGIDIEILILFVAIGLNNTLPKILGPKIVSKEEVNAHHKYLVTGAAIILLFGVLYLIENFTQIIPPLGFTDEFKNTPGYRNWTVSWVIFLDSEKFFMCFGFLGCLGLALIEIFSIAPGSRHQSRQLQGVARYSGGQTFAVRDSSGGQT